MTRRELIAIGAAAVANGAPEFAFFTPNQAALVTLIAEQIIPRDQYAGATDAGAVHYIDRQPAAQLSPFAPLYREARPAFEAMLKMSSAEQTDFLKSVGCFPS
jgi:hypothetical protein